MLIDLFDEEKEDPNEFISFLVFEPNSLRIPDNDILLMGSDVVDFFNLIISSNKFDASIKDQILLNKLQRIQMMIDLLKSPQGLIMTKFLNKIWRRYTFFSNLGEPFILKKEIKRFNPPFKLSNDLILSRIAVEIEEEVDKKTEETPDNSPETEPTTSIKDEKK
jgi:hypothetical protein